MTVNIDLLKRALAQVEEHPDQWQQAHWATPPAPECGTAHCIGGWAVVLHGVEIDPDEPCYVMPLPADEPDPGLTYNDGEMDTWDYARWLLGLEEWQANDLFASINTLADLRRIVADLCGEADR